MFSRMGGHLPTFKNGVVYNNYSHSPLTHREDVQQHRSHIYVCLCMCAYVYMYEYIYIHTHTSVYMKLMRENKSGKHF